MPFTPSHAVVALAFTRTPLVPAAIAIGAMTPDLPLFLRIGWPTYGVTHSFAAVPVTVGVALVLLLVWRCCLRGAAADLLPRRIAARLPATWERGPAASFGETFAVRGRTRPSWTGGVLLLASLVIGVLTHIVWDLFTHEGRAPASLVPLFDTQLGPFPLFRWLQHGSSFLGLAIIAVWALVWLSRRTPRPDLRTVLPPAVRWAWWASLPAALAIGWGVGLVVFGPIRGSLGVAQLAYRVLPPACAAWLAATLVLAIVVVLVRRVRFTPSA